MFIWIEHNKPFLASLESMLLSFVQSIKFENFALEKFMFFHVNGHVFVHVTEIQFNINLATTARSFLSRKFIEQIVVLWGSFMIVVDGFCLILKMKMFSSLLSISLFKVSDYFINFMYACICRYEDYVKYPPSYLSFRIHPTWTVFVSFHLFHSFFLLFPPYTKNIKRFSFRGALMLMMMMMMIKKAI